LAKYDGQLADYSKRIDAYNGGKCGGTALLPPDQYRACLAEKGELAARKIELDSERDALNAEYAAIEAATKPHLAIRDKARGELEAIDRSYGLTEKDYKAVLDRIDLIKKRLVSMCIAGDQARDPFAVRLCVGASWDADKKDFARLTDLPPVH